MIKRSLARCTLALFATLAVASLAAAESTEWKIDEDHTRAHFAVTHMMVSTVRGVFGEVSGRVVFDPENPENSSVEATIQTASIYTAKKKRDDHLRSPDFLDAAKYPTITFKSTKVEKKDDGGFAVEGDLTIRGVTKRVTLDVAPFSKAIVDPWGNRRMGTTATTKINRLDFGVSWNKVLDTGGVVVGNDVEITIEVELIQPAAK